MKKLLSLLLLFVALGTVPGCWRKKAAETERKTGPEQIEASEIK